MTLSRAALALLVLLAAFAAPAAADYYTDHPADPFHHATLQESSPVQKTGAAFPGGVAFKLDKIPSAQTYRIAFSGKPGQPASHEGIDFVHNDPKVPHVPVVAAAGGTVAYVRTGAPQSAMFGHNTSLREAGAGWGNHVVLYHGNGIYTRYAHLAPNSIKLRVGDAVAAGQVVGENGNSGRSETRHLHFELGYKGSCFVANKPAQSFDLVLDPKNYLPGGTKPALAVAKSVGVPNLAEEGKALMGDPRDGSPTTAELPPAAPSSSALAALAVATAAGETGKAAAPADRELAATAFMAGDDPAKAAGGLHAALMMQRPDAHASLYRPVAAWSGRLILPPAGQRAPSGAVWFEVENSPVPGLAGRRLWLAWDETQLWNRWFSKARIDVRIDPGKLAQANKLRLNVPTLLDGWAKVSPLESLAAGRAGLQVALRAPAHSGGTLSITEEPLQVVGVERCLARFDGPAEGNLRRVVHYNPASGNFDGPAEVVAIPAQVYQYKDDPIPQSSTALIEASPLNAGGWYLHGARVKGVFEVEALEPRLPLLVRPTQVVHGAAETKRYVGDLHWKGLAPNSYRATLLEPDAGRLATNGRAAVLDYAKSAWPLGAKGIVVHLFGWRGMSGGKAGIQEMLGLVTGHFAYGLAEVVACPFTGERRFDIAYRQVYAHNRGGIVSGTQAWHAYNGSLARGWMYTIPVSDTVIRVPELAPFDFGDGWVIRPLLGFMREFERMQALYRTGAGGGVSSVRPDVSCVQDSHCALYGALRTFEETIAQSGRLKAWLAAQPQGSPEPARYLRLLDLTRRIKRRVTLFGLPQMNWREFAERPLATREPNAVAAVLNTILGAKTMFPRHANDEILNLAAECGYPMWNVLTVQVGGTIPGLLPKAPTSPTDR